MSELSQSHIVWYGLVHLLTQIREYTAILKVFNMICMDSPNDFLTTSRAAVEKQLLLEIAKIFDPAWYRKDENCSMALLRELCLKEIEKFPDGASEPIIIKIDEVRTLYENTNLKYLRNKMMAHNDLCTMFKLMISQADYKQIVTLIENCSTIIAEIGERLLGIELEFPTIADLEIKYENSLKKLVSNEQMR